MCIVKLLHKIIGNFMGCVTNINYYMFVWLTRLLMQFYVYTSVVFYLFLLFLGIACSTRHENNTMRLVFLVTVGLNFHTGFRAL
jgi:hypothetical protein